MKRILTKRKSQISKNPDFSQSLVENDHLELHSPRTGKANGGSTGQFQTNPMIVNANNKGPSTNYHHPQPTLASVPSDFHEYFLPEEGYTWDFCMVVPNADYYKKKHEEEDLESQSKKGNNTVTALNLNKISYEDIMERLFLSGLQTYAFQSGDGDEIYIKIRAPLQRLKEHATEVGFKMLYDSTYLAKVVDKQNAPIADDPEITSLTPYQFIYGPYDMEKPQLFAKAHNLSHPFSPIIRIKLLMDIITSDEEGCCSLNLRKITNDGPNDESSSVIAYYPLHDELARDQLNKIWLNLRVKPWEQPIDEVKEYLGEKVALYFEFVGHYTTWLRSLMIAGLLVAIDMAVETAIFDFDRALLAGYSIPFYCIFVSFWSQLMIEYWKRREARKAMEWGTSDFEETQSQRPEFKGVPTHSVIDGKLVKFFDSRSKARKLWYSYFIIGLMMLLVISCVSGIFGLQYYINSDVNDDANKSTGNTAVSIFSAIQIVVLNAYYSDLAIGLNDNENHRTDTEYDDALIGKLFAFSFINSYASLFFIAFVKSNLGEACQGPCMVELAYQLFILLITKMTIEKVTNYVTLKVNQYIIQYNEVAEYREAIKENRKVFEPSKLELEKRLEAYDPSLGVLTDYAQIFIQYGFVTLFVSACPVAPLLAYIGNQVEIRGDGSKLLYDMRRTIPTGAEDIGTWAVILQMTAVIAVVTNAAIVCFVMELVDSSAWGSVWLFIGFQYVIFVSMAIFSYVVDDVPEDVQIQLQRQEYLRERAEMTDEDREEEKGKKDGQKPKHTSIAPQLFQIHDYDEENPTKEAKIPSGTGCIIC